MIFLLGLVLVSCHPSPGPPWQQWMYDGPPPSPDGKPYPDLYVLGWQHGCQTGADAQSNNFYKTFSGWRQDATLAQNKVYYRGWQDAFGYCSRYIQQYNSRQFF